MAQFKQTCIFCTENTRSKEHYWGKWLAKILPHYTQDTAHMVTTVDQFTRQMRRKEGRMNRQGNIRKQQIKGPCEPCNNGWMKDVNEAAKDTIIRLINEGPFVMTEAERTAFATWAVMLSMTYEFADASTMVSSQESRTAFYESKIPPAHWAVLIGRYENKTWAEVHNHRAIWFKTAEDDAIDSGMAQCNLFTLGKTAVVTLSGRISEIEALIPFANQNGLKIVWPHLFFLAAAPDAPLSDQQMQNIAQWRPGGPDIWLPEK